MKNKLKILLRIQFFKIYLIDHLENNDKFYLKKPISWIELLLRN